MDVSSSPTIQYQVLVVAAGLTFLAGFLINVFIVAVTICEWKKGRPVSKTDQVITSLGITRMIFQGACLLLIIIYTYVPGMNILFYLCVGFLQFISVYSNIWLSTLLSVVFCLQIFTLHNVFFLRLKTFVLQRVSHLIMAVLVVSIIYTFCNSFMQLMTIVFSTMSQNSIQEIYDDVVYGLRISALIFLFNAPFLIYIISSVLLIFYLYHHIRRMKSQSNGTSRLDTYYKTIKFTGFSLFCSTVFIIFAQASKYCFYVFGFLGYYFFWQIFPTLHSMYLIYVTVKLRSQVSNMVLLMKTKCCYPKAPEETETRL
ncbi:taste receptor type 2 member 140-like [Leptodactylus fuscus]|uniref:taste receptor type 2 member 140-like n=1 Tax=Leptodactylus fuscus TaxID=238119 RepID=UPI003F4F0548